MKTFALVLSLTCTAVISGQSVMIPDSTVAGLDTVATVASNHWTHAENLEAEEADWVQTLLVKNPDLKAFNFNTFDKAESYPSISTDGLHMFFVHHQSVDWVFYTSRKTLADDWSVPVPIKINGLSLAGPGDGPAGENATGGRLLSAAFAPDEKHIYVSGLWDGEAHLIYLIADEKETAVFQFQHECSFVNATGEMEKPGFLSCMSFCDDGRQMFAYANKDMTCYTLSGDRTWRVLYKLGTDGSIMGRVTQDGKYFIGAEGRDFGDDDETVFLIRRNSKEENFKPDNAFELYTLQNKEAHLLQPDYCPESGELLMVINNRPVWESNSVYFVKVNITDDLPPYVRDNEIVILETEASTSVEDVLVYEIPATDPGKVPEPAVAQTPRVQRPETYKSLEQSDGITASKIALGLPFPNPASQVIHFYYQAKAVESAESTKVWIHDMSGKVVYQGLLPGGNREASVNISSLAPGTYTLSVGISGLQSDGVRFSVAR